MHVYGVAMISRLLEIIGLFCRIFSLLCGSFTKETYNVKEPTNRNHGICIFVCMHVYVYLYEYPVCLQRMYSFFFFGSACDPAFICE